MLVNNDTVVEGKPVAFMDGRRGYYKHSYQIHFDGVESPVDMHVERQEHGAPLRRWFTVNGAGAFLTLKLACLSLGWTYTRGPHNEH